MNADFDRIICCQIALERCFRARGFSLPVGNDRSIIFTVRDAEIPLGRLPEMLPQEGQ